MVDEKLEKFIKILNIKPRGVAIFGPSAKRGFYWIKSLINLNYDGFIVPIHPKLKTAVGFTCYKTLDDVPPHIKVDYAIIAVPKRIVPEVLKQCIRRKVNVATVFTSGYSELDAVNGRREEKVLLDILEAGYKETGHRLRILGPNCIGSYYPRMGLGFRTDLSIESGNVGIVSQSGGLAINIALRGKMLGIKFSNVVSVGNSIDLGPAEIIKLMQIDNKTLYIGCYLESFGKSVDEGRKLIEVFKETSLNKPILLWHGGRTARGSLAASSHTGALKTNEKIFEAIVKQSGIILINSFEEFMDTLLAFQMVGQFSGKNIALISISGGSGVTSTDDIIMEGLSLPDLSKETQANIAKAMLADVGMSVKNPVDLGASYYGFSVIKKTIEETLKDPSVDILFMEISSHYIYNATILSYKDFPALYFSEVLKAMRKAKRDSKKPIFVIMPEIAYEQETINDRQTFLKKNIPVFPTVRRAAKALANLVKYTDFLNKHSIDRKL
ncbi:MAG: CoA-binding protein [Promethearchaeota archaeon]